MTFPILSIISSDRHSGPGVAALAQARVLHDAGWPVTFACIGGGSLEEKARAIGVTVDNSLHLPRRGEVWQIPADVKHIQRLAKDTKARLILVHRTVEMLSAGLAFRSGSVPVLRVWHDGHGQRPDMGTRLLSRMFNVKMVATTLCGARALGELSLPGEAAVLRAVVPDEFFAAGERDEAERQRLGFECDDVVVAFVARCKPGRGHDLFLDAFEQARAQTPKLHALLIGGGELRPWLEEAVDKRGLSPYVRFEEPPRERFISTLQASDFGILLRPGTDGSSRAALELMAMSRPVVLARYGALADIGLGAAFGAVRFGDDAATLAVAMSTYVNQDESLRRDGQAARDWVIAHHNTRAFCDKFESLVASGLS